MRRQIVTTETLLSESNDVKEKAALVSIGVKVILALGKLIAGLMSGSLALLSEAANNFGDIAIVCFSFIAIRIANKPADEDHHYGHAKVEALAALAQTGFLFGLAVYIFASAIRRLSGAAAADVTPSALSFGVLAASIIVDFWRWHSLEKVARRTRSDALAADAFNFATDIVASMFAVLGLTAVHFGYWRGDALGALGVATFIAIAGFSLARRTVDALIDAAPPGLTEKINKIALAVPDVISVDGIRLRPSGGEILGDVSIAVSRTLPIERVTTVKNDLKAAIAKLHPEVSILVATRSIALDNETILDRVRFIAGERHIPIHHLTVQEIAGRVSISFDAEMDGRMTHRQAHEAVTALESAVRRGLGEAIEVDTHIEPLEPRELSGQDASREVHAEIASALARRAAQTGVLSEVHNVRVRETPAGLVVNYHCRVDPDLSVREVHERVDSLDHMTQGDFSNIARIVGHADLAMERENISLN
jgi:cation diffusion facilitator family transporter